MREVDLHGLTPRAALRRLAQELHAARVQGRDELCVVTGRGLGNRAQKPILRQYVEDWLRGSEGQRLGVLGFDRTHAGGALRVRLGRGSRQ